MSSTRALLRFPMTLLLLAFLTSAVSISQIIIRTDRPTMKLDRRAQSQVLDSICTRITKYYLFPDVGKKMVDELRHQFTNGSLKDIPNPVDFARQVTQILLGVGHDKHTSVAFDPRNARDLLVNQQPAEASRKPSEDMLKHLREANFGFEKLELLGGNIGYLRLTGFAGAQYGGETAASAMRFLANADALIIDIRQNGGGDGSMVAFLCSYFFGGDPRRINTSVFRNASQNEESWTAAYVPGKPMPEVHLFILTSSRTFSAAEEFAYDLQSMKRGTIVGEATGGGAHFNEFVAVDSNFVMSVSIGQAVNPITHTNWEGVGVKPDIEVPQDKALEVAEIAALKKLRESASDDQQKHTLDWMTESLSAELNPVTVPEPTLKKYVGTYGERTISFENGPLYYQRNGRPKFMMIPMSEKLFRFRDLENFRVRFDADENGRVKLSGLYDNGMVD